MNRFRILHRTYYNFSDTVVLGPHVLRLRPREGHDLRIESSRLEIEPAAQLRWYRDAENNILGMATFASPTMQLAIVSDLVVQQYNSNVEGLAAARGAAWPVAYEAIDLVTLAHYRETSNSQRAVDAMMSTLRQQGCGAAGQPIYQAMLQLSNHIRTAIRYVVRPEAGVQSPADTLGLGSGSCRDMAALFVEAARRLGLASRFVSGYLRIDGSGPNFGATHAWAEVYLPGIGWTGFDPTADGTVGPDHFAVAVARDPGTVPPVSGSFSGAGGSTLDVGVWVTSLAAAGTV